MKNVFYLKRIAEIGGIETFFYYLAKKYADNDITAYCEDGDAKQIERLKKYVRVKRYRGEKIKCDKAFFNYCTDIIDNVEAKEYIQIAHADYEACRIKPNIHPKITKYIGVSKWVCDTYKKATGFDTELCYNPIEIEKPKKVLNLISATRLTDEKGKDRIKKLATLLDNAGIPYIWTIYTNDKDAIKNSNIIYAKPRLDIIDYIANADYLVQLSDAEGYCYSVVEALSVGTPVIVTKCPVFKELGVNKSNGFMLDFELNNVPIKEIYKGLPKFEYKPKADSWGKLLAKGESTYKKDLKTMVSVKAIQPYYDIELSKNITPADPPFKVNKVRAETLRDAGVCEEVS